MVKHFRVIVICKSGSCPSTRTVSVMVSQKDEAETAAIPYLRSGERLSGHVVGPYNLGILVGAR